MKDKDLKRVSKEFRTVEDFATSTIKFDDDPDIKRI